MRLAHQHDEARFADARRRARHDPTGTAGLRRRWRNDAEIRLRQLRAQLRAAVVDNDILGLGGEGMAQYQPALDRLRALQQWFERMALGTLGGPWPDQHVDAAWQSGHSAAAAETGAVAAFDRRDAAHLSHLAQAEFAGIAAALTQQVVRASVAAATKGLGPVQAFTLMAKPFNKMALHRLRANVNVVAVKAHNDAKLDSYREAGVALVGILPESRRTSLNVHQGALRDADPGGPQTLYVRRDVENAADIIRWFKRQGFETTLPADDMHDMIKLNPGEGADLVSQTFEKPNVEAVRKWTDTLFKQQAHDWDPDQPRESAGSPEGGRWAGGSGSRETIGHGYSHEATLVGGVIHTSNVYDAVRAIYENRKVELNQPRELSTLVDKLADVSQHMIDLGGKAPNFNLCNVTVRATNLFCADAKGIPRAKMPQLEDAKAFRDWLKDKGYKITKEDEHPSHLRATQSELNGLKVANMAAKLQSSDKKQDRIVVSREGYVLDGHHRWAAQVAIDAADNKLNAKMRIARVDANITDLLALANKYTGGKGAKGFGDAFNPDEPRNEGGEWTSGGGSAKAEPDLAAGPREPKEFMTVAGKPAWGVVVDTLDNAVIHVVRQAEGEDGDWHHNFYLPEHMVAKVNSGAAMIVWGDQTGLQSMSPMPPETRQALMPYYGAGEPDHGEGGEPAPQPAQATGNWPPPWHKAGGKTWAIPTFAPPAPPAPLKIAELTKVGPQMGSNAGGVYQDKGGKKFYVKQGKSADHVRNELIAARLYRLAGAPTLRYREVEGGLHVATEMEPLEKKTAAAFTPEDIDEARLDFVPHAWLANWDAVGLEDDNLGTAKDGRVIELDVGGALEYRAQGAPKGAAFGTKVGEIDSMRDPHISPQASRIFGGMTVAQLRQSAGFVTKITDQEIKDVVKDGGGSKPLAEKLIARRDDIARQAKTFGAQGDPKKPGSTVVFAAGEPLPVKMINGIKLKAWTPPKDWNEVDGQIELGEEALPEHLPTGKQLASGLIMREPDGRVWLVRPKNAHGGYQHTFPKGRIEPDLSLQANAIKEAWEETGIKARITGLAGDREGDLTRTRYYYAERETGDPSDQDQKESEGVLLVPPARLNEFLNRKRDRDIAAEIAAGSGSRQTLAHAMSGAESGNHDFVRVFHGTTAELVKAIANEGLKPKGGVGADEWLKQNHPDKFAKIEAEMASGAPLSVYVSKQPAAARMFAKYAAQATGGEATVLVVDIPTDVAKKFMKRDKWSGTLRHTEYGFKGVIKPEWIVGTISPEQRESTKIAPITKDADDSDVERFYFVVVAGGLHPTADAFTALFDKGAVETESGRAYYGGRSGPASRASREETPSASTIYRVEKAQENLEEEVGDLVGVETAGDELVCDDCQEIADGGPYTLDEAQGLIPAHANCRCAFFSMDRANDAAPPVRAAGVMFVAPDGHALFAKRVDTGEWALPAGGVEEGEDALRAAQREAAEEVGWPGDHQAAEMDRRTTNGVDFSTFLQPVAQKFEPILNGEHSAFTWASPHAPPEPLHPGLKATLKAALTMDYDPDQPRDDHGEWSGGGGGGSREPYRFYHGTTKDAVASIRKHGLVPAKKGGGITWGGARGMKFTSRGHKLNVFIAMDAEAASDFAAVAAAQRGTKPVVMEINFPRSEWDKVQHDEMGGEGMCRYQGVIKPEYIGRELKPSASRVRAVQRRMTKGDPLFKDDDDHRAYLIIFPDDDALNEYAVDWDPDQPREPAGSSEGGQWAGGSGGDVDLGGKAVDPEMLKAWKAGLAPYAKAMEGKCREVAAAMSVDPDLVVVSTGSQQNEMGTVAASTDNNTGKVTMFAQHCNPATFAGVLAHELEHVKYAQYRKVVKAEAAQVEKMSDDEVRAAYAKGELGTYREFAEVYDVPKLREEDGVSNYSAQWWSKYDQSGGKWSSSAVHETLAEMARKKLETGELPGGLRFQALYGLVRSFWHERKPQGYHS